MYGSGQTSPHNPVQYFHQSKKFSHALTSLHLISSTILSPGKHDLLFNSINLIFLDNSYKWDHKINGVSHLTFLDSIMVLKYLYNKLKSDM